jgi:hypothetical protein
MLQTDNDDTLTQSSFGMRKLSLGAIAVLLKQLRIQSERFELSPPFRGRVAESLHTDAARQPPFDRCLHELWCEECKRDGHIDLAHAAFLTRGNLLNVSD